MDWKKYLMVTASSTNDWDFFEGAVYPGSYCCDNSHFILINNGKLDTTLLIKAMDTDSN